MEDCANRKANIKFGSQTFSHHTSSQYGAQYFSKHGLARRNSSLETKNFDKINKEEIFEFVHKFLGRLVSDSSYLRQIFQDLNFETSDLNISIQRLSTEDIASIQDMIANKDNDNEKAINSNLDEATPNDKEKGRETEKEKKKDGRQAKVSIMVDSFRDFCFSSGSCTSIINISSIKFPSLNLNISMIRKIFEEPEAFLINLALCLMIKFLFYSKIKISNANSCWILSIATIIAYKIYYDEPVEGLLESFSDILEIKTADIKELQRYFLDQIKFQAVITNEQYHIILAKVIAVGNG